MMCVSVSVCVCLCVCVCVCVCVTYSHFVQQLVENGVCDSLREDSFALCLPHYTRQQCKHTFHMQTASNRDFVYGLFYLNQRELSANISPCNVRTSLLVFIRLLPVTGADD